MSEDEIEGYDDGDEGEESGEGKSKTVEGPAGVLP